MHPSVRPERAWARRTYRVARESKGGLQRFAGPHASRGKGRAERPRSASWPLLASLSHRASISTFLGEFTSRSSSSSIPRPFLHGFLKRKKWKPSGENLPGLFPWFFSYQEGVGGQEPVRASRKTGSAWRCHSKNKPYGKEKLCVEFTSNEKREKFMSYSCRKNVMSNVKRLIIIL